MQRDGGCGVQPDRPLSPVHDAFPAGAGIWFWKTGCCEIRPVSHWEALKAPDFYPWRGACSWHEAGRERVANGDSLRDRSIEPARRVDSSACNAIWRYLMPTVTCYTRYRSNPTLMAWPTRLFLRHLCRRRVRRRGALGGARPRGRGLSAEGPATTGSSRYGVRPVWTRLNTPR